jgi:putative Mn2+ efflux pump MntP
VGIVILVLLLLAAITGVLGAVLKVTLVLVLSLFLAIVLLVWIGTWYAKRRMRAFQRDVETRVDQARRRRDAVDVEPEPGRPAIGDGR